MSLNPTASYQGSSYVVAWFSCHPVRASIISCSPGCREIIICTAIDHFLFLWNISLDPHPNVHASNSSCWSSQAPLFTLKVFAEEFVVLLAFRSAYVCLTLNLIWINLIWFYLIWFNSILFYLIQFSLIKFNLIQSPQRPPSHRRPE